MDTVTRDIKWHLDSSTITNEWETETVGNQKIHCHRDWREAMQFITELCDIGVTAPMPPKQERNYSQSEYRAAVYGVLNFVELCNSAYLGCTRNYFLFRGQQSANWAVTPTLLREDTVQTLFRSNLYPFSKNILNNKILELENILLELFIRDSRPHVGLDYAAIEFYMLGQHHGLKTRLLDWTSNFYTALWFAVENSSPYTDNEDGLLIFMDPYKNSDDCYKDRNKLRRKKFWTKEKIFQYYELILKQNKTGDENRVLDECYENEAAIYYTGKVLCPRQVNQSAHFTFHSPAPCDAPSICNYGVNDFYHTCTYIIPKEHKKYLRNFLIATGITRHQIFPDLDNLAKCLNEGFFVARK